MINVIKANLSPIFYILLFILVTVVALYFSLCFLILFTFIESSIIGIDRAIYALNGFIDTLKSDYENYEKF